MPVPTHRCGFTLQRFTVQGFTLIEVLVAFSIFSTALALIYQVYARGSVAAILAEEYTIALGIAESQLATASVYDKPLANTDNGTVLDKYHWQVTTERWEDTQIAEPEHSRYRLKKVSVQVSWQSQNGARQINLNGIKPQKIP